MVAATEAATKLRRLDQLVASLPSINLDEDLLTLLDHTFPHVPEPQRKALVTVLKLQTALYGTQHLGQPVATLDHVKEWLEDGIDPTAAERLALRRVSAELRDLQRQLKAVPDRLPQIGPRRTVRTSTSAQLLRAVPGRLRAALGRLHQRVVSRRTERHRLNDEIRQKKAEVKAASQAFTEAFRRRPPWDVSDRPLAVRSEAERQRAIVAAKAANQAVFRHGALNATGRQLVVQAGAADARVAQDRRDIATRRAEQAQQYEISQRMWTQHTVIRRLEAQVQRLTRQIEFDAALLQNPGRGRLAPTDRVLQLTIDAHRAEMANARQRLTAARQEVVRLSEQLARVDLDVYPQLADLNTYLSELTEDHEGWPVPDIKALRQLGNTVIVEPVGKLQHHRTALDAWIRHLRVAQHLAQEIAQGRELRDENGNVVPGRALTRAQIRQRQQQHRTLGAFMDSWTVIEGVPAPPPTTVKRRITEWEEVQGPQISRYPMLPVHREVIEHPPRVESPFTDADPQTWAGATLEITSGGSGYTLSQFLPPWKWFGFYGKFKFVNSTVVKGNVEWNGYRSTFTWRGAFTEAILASRFENFELFMNTKFFYDGAIDLTDGHLDGHRLWETEPNTAPTPTAIFHPKGTAVATPWGDLPYTVFVRLRIAYDQYFLPARFTPAVKLVDRGSIRLRARAGAGQTGLPARTTIRDKETARTPVVADSTKYNQTLGELDISAMVGGYIDFHWGFLQGAASLVISGVGQLLHIPTDPIVRWLASVPIPPDQWIGGFAVMGGYGAYLPFVASYQGAAGMTYAQLLAGTRPADYVGALTGNPMQIELHGSLRTDIEERLYWFALPYLFDLPGRWAPWYPPSLPSLQPQDIPGLGFWGTWGPTWLPLLWVKARMVDARLLPWWLRRALPRHIVAAEQQAYESLDYQQSLQETADTWMRQLERSGILTGRQVEDIQGLLGRITSSTDPTAVAGLVHLLNQQLYSMVSAPPVEPFEIGRISRHLTGPLRLPPR